MPYMFFADVEKIMEACLWYKNTHKAYMKSQGWRFF